MKPKNLTFACEFQDSDIQEKVEENNWKISRRDLRCSLHAALISGGS